VTRLVLLGGGHAHLFVLEALARRRFPPAEVALVSEVRWQAYSGMVPGLIGGRYRSEDVSFDLASIARCAGARFVGARAARIRPDRRLVEVVGADPLEYDILSIATGSSVQGSELAAMRERVLLAKPIERAREIVPVLTRIARENGAAEIAVVGGGAAGVEIALAVSGRLRALQAARARVTLLEAAPRLLPERSARAGRAAARALARQGVLARCGEEVTGAAPGSLLLAGGARRADVVVLAAGAASSELLRTSGLAQDGRGFLLVDDALRSVSDARIFAAGDAATPARFPETPKAGVYAVRAGPVLRDNLAAACAGRRPPRRYTLRRRFLAILNTGDGRAIATYGGLAAEGHWVMALKDAIDRRFMRRFQRLAGCRAADAPIIRW